MKCKLLSTLSGVFLLAFSTASAASLTVTFESFLEPSDFNFTGGESLNLRVTELTSPETNSSTHLLVESLSPLESGSLVYASSYAGVDIESGEEQDTGVLYLEMSGPVDVPEGSVSSPIVGVVERSGSWDDYNPVQPVSSVGGASGTGDYSTEGSLVVSLEREGENFAGTASYSVVDEDTVELEPFSLIKDGVETIELSGATLVRDGLTFSGAVTNQGVDALYDSLLFAVRLTDMPDTDMDGVPDLTDASMDSGIVLTVGEWQTTPLGTMYGATESWGWSLDYGFVEVARAPVYYQPFAGWMQWMGEDGEADWFYGLSHDGWMRVAKGSGGHYEYGVEADGSSSEGNFHSGLMGSSVAGTILR